MSKEKAADSVLSLHHLSQI